MTLIEMERLLVGGSQPMRHLRELVARLAPISLPVLITGETGSGKDLVARALHRSSRRSGAFVALNVCAIPETMFEATLFGHVRGAFTGAVAQSAGYLAEANGGSLFLDEISGLALAAQAKLLRAVENKEYRQIGAQMDRRSDFRVIAATNEDLPRLVQAGCFRADLLQRLGGVRLHVPALRERLEDIPELVEHFAAYGRNTRGTRLRFSDDALRQMQDYKWPGNVRELRNAVECASALAESDVVSSMDVTLLLQAQRSAVSLPAPSQSAEQHLLASLLDTDWDVNEVARQLNVHRATIYRRLKRIGAMVQRESLQPAQGIDDRANTCGVLGASIARAAIR